MLVRFSRGLQGFLCRTDCSNHCPDRLPITGILCFGVGGLDPTGMLGPPAQPFCMQSESGGFRVDVRVERRVEDSGFCGI